MPATNNATEIKTTSTEPVNNASVRDADIKSKNTPQQTKSQVMAQPPPVSPPSPVEATPEPPKTITIPEQNYQQLIYESRLLRDIVLKLDSLIHVEKGGLSMCLNQTVRAHNLLAELEGMKDAILANGQPQHRHGTQKI